MRILSAAAALEEVESKQLMDAMKAQFHKALDIKYAVFQDVVWSMYAHPLKELTDEMFLDAIQQVYYGAVNFGTSYKSTDIQFGMGDEE